MDKLTAEIVGGLDLVPIPATRPTARPHRRSRARVDLAMVAAVLLVGLITATAAAPYAQRALSEGVRLLERVLPPRSLPLLGGSLAGVRLGTTPDDVLRVLGTPSRRSVDTQWIYDRGILVVFSPTTSEVTGREETWRVQRIVAWSGSGAGTEEGFFLDRCSYGPGFDARAPGCDLMARLAPGAFRESRAFRERYSTFDIEEWTNGRSTRFEPFRILSVRGLTPDGGHVVLRASFGPLAERIELSYSQEWIFREERRQGLPPQRSRELPAWSPIRADPFAVSACELLARAEITAGYGEGWGIANHHGHQDASGRVCSVRSDGPGDPHVFWYPRTVRPHEVDSLLTELPRVLDKSLFPRPEGGGSARGWRSTGSGRWSAFHPTGDPMVAVYVQPYFFVVTADTEDHAERLADAVRAELTGP